MKYSYSKPRSRNVFVWFSQDTRRSTTNNSLNWKELDCHHGIIQIVKCLFCAPRCVCLFMFVSDWWDRPLLSHRFQFEGYLFALPSLWQAGRENVTVVSDSNYLAAVNHLSRPLLFASTSFVSHRLIIFWPFLPLLLASWFLTISYRDTANFRQISFDLSFILSGVWTRFSGTGREALPW